MQDKYLINENIKNQNITNETYIEIYKNMLTLRSLEMYADSKYKSGDIRGFCHLVIGQENIYMSLQQVLDKNDKLIGSYRCHGLAYISGISLESILSELLGKSTGNCKGKGGSMHLYNKTFYGGHGIVGAQVSLGTGIGYALKYMKMKNVCFIFYGDGASNQGQVYESFNMAKLWNLPIVFVCENNMYGMWTPENDVCSFTEYYKKGWNIPGIRINDKNLQELTDTLRYAREYAVSNGPIILQIDTYRTCGHSCSDFDDFYRSNDEKNKQIDEDCLKNLRNRIKNFMSEKEIEDIDKEILKKFEESATKISYDNEPDIKELYTDILK